MNRSDSTFTFNALQRGETLRSLILQSDHTPASFPRIFTSSDSHIWSLDTCCPADLPTDLADVFCSTKESQARTVPPERHNVAPTTSMNVAVAESMEGLKASLSQTEREGHLRRLFWAGWLARASYGAPETRLTVGQWELRETEQATGAPAVDAILREFQKSSEYGLNIQEVSHQIVPPAFGGSIRNSSPSVNGGEGTYRESCAAVHKSQQVLTKNASTKRVCRRPTKSKVSMTTVSQARARPKTARTRRDSPSSSHSEKIFSKGMLNKDKDVLCGRGGRSNNNAGNQLYLKECSKLRAQYKAAVKKDKINISSALIETVHEWGGRFVERVEEGLERYLEARTYLQLHPEGTTRSSRYRKTVRYWEDLFATVNVQEYLRDHWYEVSRDRSREKASQALREKKKEEGTYPDSEAESYEQFDYTSEDLDGEDFIPAA